MFCKLNFNQFIFFIYMSFLNKLPHKILIIGLSLAVLQGLPTFLVSERHKNWTFCRINLITPELVSKQALYPAVFSDSSLCPHLQSQQRNGCDLFNFTNSSSTQNSSAYTEIQLFRLHWCKEKSTSGLGLKVSAAVFKIQRWEIAVWWQLKTIIKGGNQITAELG